MYVESNVRHLSSNGSVHHVLAELYDVSKHNMAIAAATDALAALADEVDGPYVSGARVQYTVTLQRVLSCDAVGAVSGALGRGTFKHLA